jgi:hypothetical protein
VRVVEQGAEDRLRDVVAARGELVEHQVLARHVALLRFVVSSASSSAREARTW